MKKLYLAFLLFLPLGSFGQDYFNRLFTPSVNNALIKRIVQFEDEIIIPFDYISSAEKTEAALFITDLESQHEIHFSNLNLGPIPSIYVEDSPYLVGTNSDLVEPNISCMKLDTEWTDSLWFKQYATPGSYTINSGFATIGDYLYILNVTFYPDEQRVLQLVKIDQDGNQVWSKLYNEDFKLSYAWDLIKTKDNNLIIAAGIVYYGISKRFDHILKVDQDGTILWSQIGNEKFSNGSIPNWVAQLPNESVVTTYVTENWDYIASGWHQYPIQFKCYSNQGDSLWQSEVRVPFRYGINFYQLKGGKGDYFFAYGNLDDSESGTLAGYLTKFSSTGDSIWQRSYHMENLVGQGASHTINDIIEYDNGDLLVLGTIRQFGEPNKIWLFKVNEHGCFGGTNCSDVILTGTDEQSPLLFESNLILQPNPTQNLVNISITGTTLFTKHQLFSFDGKLIREIKSRDKQISIDLSDQANGFYFLRSQRKDGILVVNKIVRL